MSRLDCDTFNGIMFVYLSNFDLSNSLARSVSRFRSSLFKGLWEPPRSAVASAEAKYPFRRVLFCQAFFFAPSATKKKAGEDLGKSMCKTGNPPLVWFPEPLRGAFVAEREPNKIGFVGQILPITSVLFLVICLYDLRKEPCSQ